MSILEQIRVKCFEFCEKNNRPATVLKLGFDDYMQFIKELDARTFNSTQTKCMFFMGMEVKQVMKERHVSVEDPFLKSHTKTWLNL